MAFDNDGRFRPQILHEFFERNDKDGKGGLTFEEGLYGLRRIRFAWDIFGQISTLFECEYPSFLLERELADVSLM